MIYNEKAEDYIVDKEADRFYFFNPFRVEILKRVMKNIIESYYDDPREMLLFFYYPDDEYITYLMSVEEITFYDEISCDDLFEENKERERVLIFSMGGQDNNEF